MIKYRVTDVAKDLQISNKAVIEAIDYFTAEGGGDKMSGGLCIFANGNTSDEGEYWPACYDKVVAVGAITCMKTPASYSSRGDLYNGRGAPGRMFKVSSNERSDNSCIGPFS